MISNPQGNPIFHRVLLYDTFIKGIGTIREWSREEREYTVIPQAFKPRDATERRGDPDAEGGGIPEARGGIPRFEGLRDDRMFPNFEASFTNCHYLSKADCHKEAV